MSLLRPATRTGLARGTRVSATLPALLVVALAVAGGTRASATPADATSVTSPALDDMSLEQLMDLEVVYAASRHEQKLSEAPSNVTVLTRDDFASHGYRTLADVLAGVRGFFVTYDRNYTYAGVRGFGRLGDYNTRVLLTVDGHRLNDNMYDMAMLGTEAPVDLDIVDRIEIVRGPGSAMYGTSAVFAVINLVTRASESTAVRMLAASGSDVSRGFGTVGTWKGPSGLSALASATGLRNSGHDLYYSEYDDPSTNSGLVSGLDDDRRYVLFGRMSGPGWSLEGSESNREKGIPTGAYGMVFGDPRPATWDFRQYLVAHATATPHERLDLEARASYDRYDYRGTYVFDYGSPGSPDIVDYHDFSYGRWWTGSTHAMLRVGERQTLSAGGEYRRNPRESQGGYDATSTYMDINTTSTIWALYAQHERQFAPWLRSNLGLRYDHYSRSGPAVNPRAAAILTPDGATTVKLMAGRAFRTPNAYELFYGSGNQIRPAPDLESETMWTYEVDVERRLTPELAGALSAFRYDIHGLISQRTDSDGVLVYANMDQAQAQGMEVELRGRSRGGLRGTLSWSVQRAWAASGVLPNSPRHLGKCVAAIPMGSDRFELAPDVQFVSRRRTLAGGFVDAYLLTNLTLTARPWGERLEFSGSVYNAGNEAYADPGAEEHVQEAIPQDGRSWQLRVRAKL